MKKKIAIIGSTGSIGRTTFEIAKENKKNLKIVLLSTHKNINLVQKQSKLLNVKNIIVTSRPHYLKLIKKNKNKKIKLFYNFDQLNKIFKNKIDYVMSSISGIDGLNPTLKIIKFTKNIAIANKESIICGWNLINKNLKKNNTKLIPVDSEHFSIWSLMENSNKNIVDEIIITASGGPFLNKPLHYLKKAKPHNALKHPNWSMGKKISIDSATMMNKVFEIIEAKKIFNISQKKIKILIHPSSYLHAIIKFKNGLTKLLIHETKMKVPIFNSIYLNKKVLPEKKRLNITNLNNLNLSEPNIKKFPVLKILNTIPKKDTLYETVLISINDELVKNYLEKKINFTDISKYILKLMNYKDFKKYSKIIPKNVNQITTISKLVRLKTKELCIK